MDFQRLIVVFLACGWVNAAPLIHKNILSDKVQLDSTDFLINLSHLGNKIYGGPSKKTGNNVARWNNTSKVNPEELGEYVEGDILQTKSSGRNGLISPNSRWPNGVVPYILDSTFDSAEEALIMKAMEDYHRETCIRFVVRTNEPDYIHITGIYGGCFSTVGRIGGSQQVNFQTPQCVTEKGTVIHELMHAIGFFHEQSRMDRDDYVKILFDNVQYGMYENFAKTSQPTTTFGVEYDYHSVMHYSKDAFSVNGLPTIVPKNDIDVELGQREGFSENDIKKIRKMYHCDMSQEERETIAEKETSAVAMIKKCILFNLFCWNEIDTLKNQEITTTSPAGPSEEEGEENHQVEEIQEIRPRQTSMRTRKSKTAEEKEEEEEEENVLESVQEVRPRRKRPRARKEETAGEEEENELEQIQEVWPRRKRPKKVKSKMISKGIEDYDYNEDGEIEHSEWEEIEQEKLKRKQGLMKNKKNRRRKGKKNVKSSKTLKVSNSKSKDKAKTQVQNKGKNPEYGEKNLASCNSLLCMGQELWNTFFG